MKSIIDRGVALIILTLVSPLLLTACLAIVIESDGSAIFRQKRVGRGQILFDVLKLRTMVVDGARVDSQTFNDSAGVTRVGSVLRRWKLDELPQLINVLKGDMSLVGPRPCLPQLLNEMDEESKLRFNVRPGLTGWAQVKGNVALSWAARWAYDVEYVKSQSFLLDIKILSKTILVVFLGEERFKEGKKP